MKDEEKKNNEEMSDVHRAVDEIVWAARKNDHEWESVGEMTDKFRLVHGSPGGMRKLIDAAFILLENPLKKHKLAKFLQAHENEIHGNEKKVMICMRKKCGSNGSSFSSNS